MVPDEIKQLFLKGKDYYKKHDYRKAKEIFREINTAYPEEEFSYLILGQFLLGHSMFREAELVFSKAIKIFPENYTFYYLLAQSYNTHYNYQMFETKFKPDNELLPLQRFNYFFTEEKPVTAEMYTKTEALYLKALELAVDNEEIIDATIKFYIRHYNLEKAQEILDSYMDSDNKGFLLKLQSYIYNKQGKYKRAGEVFNEAQRKVLDTKDDPLSLGRAHYYLGEYEDAIPYLKNAVKMNPEDYLGYIHLARSYAELNKEKLFEETLKDGIKNSIDKKLLTRTLFLYYDSIGKIDESLRYKLENIRSDPREFHQYYYLIKAFKLQSTYSAEYFVDFFKELLQEDPDLAKSRIFNYYLDLFSDYNRWQLKILDWLKEDLERIVEYTRAKGIHLILLNYPYPYDYISGVINEVSEEHSVDLIDLSSKFSSVITEDNRDDYFKDDDHCTTLGHKLMAETILEYLKKTGIVDD